MGCSNNSFKVEDENIHYTNQALFNKKLEDYINSYKQNKKSVAIVTDFDYTITSRFDYQTNEEFKSSYYLYDEDIIGGDQKKFLEKRKKLYDEYSKYEFSTSYDYELRYKKMEEWYTKDLENFFNDKFTPHSIEKMTQKCFKNIKFRKYAKEFIELLISKDIPIIIISGGIAQFIASSLKIIIPNFDKYIEEKKIIIVSNTFKFDPSTQGCVGLEHEVIFCFNKADFLGSVVNGILPDLKNIIVMGDHLNDPDSIKKLNVHPNNVIGMGFLNLPPNVLSDPQKKEYIKGKIEENKKAYDLTLVGDCDYSHVNKYIKQIKN